MGRGTRMALRRIQLSFGDKFGQLSVVREVEPIKWRKYKKRMVLCRCVCGHEIIVRLEYLKSGHTKSCGCLRVATASTIHLRHGCARGIRLYKTWAGMKQRCLNPNVKGFENYGGRGIAICEDWMEFVSFRDWATGNGYRDDLTIERLDVNGDYEPSNCTWIPKSEQSKNRRCVGAAS